MEPLQSLTPAEPKKTKSGYDPMDLKQARAFNETATTVFAPIYPVIAGQIIERTGKIKGTALDVGSGPALLAIALAKQTELRVFTLDFSPMMLTIASEQIKESGLGKRIAPVFGNVHEIPFEDGTIDLIVSRGSWFFWDDLAIAFAEIYRVLAPDGYVYIGGGFGNAILRDQIHETMRKKNPNWDKEVQERINRNHPDHITEQLSKAGIHSYHLIQDESGFWAVIRKEV